MRRTEGLLADTHALPWARDDLSRSARMPLRPRGVGGRVAPVDSGVTPPPSIAWRPIDRASRPAAARSGASVRERERGAERATCTAIRGCPRSSAVRASSSTAISGSCPPRASRSRASSASACTRCSSACTACRATGACRRCPRCCCASSRCSPTPTTRAGCGSRARERRSTSTARSASSASRTTTTRTTPSTATRRSRSRST